MKKNVKSTISYFKLLIKHSQKPYEPSPEHILKRMLIPICESMNEICDGGTRNDAWDLVEGFAKECRRLV
jgi:hypothetical protein